MKIAKAALAEGHYSFGKKNTQSALLLLLDHLYRSFRSQITSSYPLMVNWRPFVHFNVHWKCYSRVYSTKQSIYANLRYTKFQTVNNLKPSRQRFSTAGSDISMHHMGFLVSAYKMNPHHKCRTSFMKQRDPLAYGFSPDEPGQNIKYEKAVPADLKAKHLRYGDNFATILI